MAEKRPWGITLNVALLVISGILMLLMTLGLAIATSLSFITELLPIAGFLAIAVIVMLGLTVVVFVVAYFLWQGNMYAWWTLTILLILGIIGNAYSLIAMTALPIIAIVIQLLLLLGLLHKTTISFVNPGIKWAGWELED